MQDLRSSIHVLLSNRAFLYSFLGRAFAVEADEEFLEAVRQAETQCSLLDDEGAQGALLCRQAVSALDDLGDDALDTLKSEYTKLMIGPGELPSPPWESVFVEKAQLLFQPSTLEVREAYRKQGFQAKGYPREADDHIAIEMDFMASMSRRALEAFERGDDGRCRETLEAQLSFLDEHLGVWVPEFALHLRNVCAISAFYPSLASLGELVCQRDARLVRELLDSL